jgi:hypothetical protein
MNTPTVVHHHEGNVARELASRYGSLYQPLVLRRNLWSGEGPVCATERARAPARAGSSIDPNVNQRSGNLAATYSRPIHSLAARKTGLAFLGDERNGQHRNDHGRAIVTGEMSRDGCIRCRNVHGDNYLLPVRDLLRTVLTSSTVSFLWPVRRSEPNSTGHRIC